MVNVIDLTQYRVCIVIDLKPILLQTRSKVEKGNFTLSTCWLDFTL